MALVEVYSEAKYLELLQAGVALTTIEHLAEAPPDIRDELEALAIEVQDDLAVTDALRAWVKLEQKVLEALSPEGLAKMLLKAAERSLRVGGTPAPGAPRRKWPADRGATALRRP